MSNPGRSMQCWAWAGWEPQRHYLRMGSSSTPYFGRGDWLEAWRGRMESEQTLASLRDAGVTTLVTCCYKGFGLELESRDWPELRRFVDRAHHFGLKVWGYTQGGSLYLETLLIEQPDARQWIARQFDGSPQTWSSAYYRFSPCLNHPDYLAYLEQVAERALREVGLDGLHQDNNYYKHCWCERCQSAFRAWLNAMPDLEARTGLPCADHVIAPPLPAEQLRFADPLQQLWMEFGVQTRLRALQRLRSVVKRTRPEAWLIGNPAFPRRPACKARLALDPAREGTVADALFAENGNLPRAAPSGYISQIEAYAYAEAGGYRVLSSAWQPGSHGHTPPTSPAQLWTQLAEEFSHRVAIPGNNWALRPAGDGDRLLMDEPTLFTAFAEAMRFFHQLTDAADLHARRAWSELAVLIEPDTMTLAAGRDAPAFHALLQELLRRHLPFRVVFASQPIPADVRALLVWQQSCLSDEVLANLQAFAQRPGCAVLLAGETGRFNEAHIPRSASAWEAWRSSPGMTYHPVDPAELARVTSSTQHLGTDLSSATPACCAALDALLAASAWQPHLALEAAPHVLISVESVGSNRLLIHWRDQGATDEPIEGCRLRLQGPLTQVQRVRLYRPDHDALDLWTAPQSSAAPEEAERLIVLPAFRRYGLLELGYDSPRFS